jgi:hypothetical protein
MESEHVTDPLPSSESKGIEGAKPEKKFEYSTHLPKYALKTYFM